MDDHYPPIFVEATADDILAVLRDMHRQQCTHNPEANPRIALYHESSIANWRDACNLLPWPRLAEGMNAYWSATISMDEWRAVLEPAKTRQLRGVCELLARQVRLPRIRPATILGSTCVTAGAFLTVRSYLAAAGADVSDLGPSTPLHRYTRRYPHVFFGPVSQLAPGALPPVQVRTPVYDAFVYGIFAAWIGIVVGACGGLVTTSDLLFAIGILSGLLFAICYAGVWTLGRWIPPASVEFRGLSTFRDLSAALVTGPPA